MKIVFRSLKIIINLSLFLVKVYTKFLMLEENRGLTYYQQIVITNHKMYPHQHIKIINLVFLQIIIHNKINLQ